MVRNKKTYIKTAPFLSSFPYLTSLLTRLPIPSRWRRLEMGLMVSTQRFPSAASPSSHFPSALHGLFHRLISDLMPGAPPSLLLWPWCFLCWFSLLFPLSSLSKAFSSLFKIHYHREGQGAQLYPAVGWLEVAGTGHVQHRAAPASRQKGHPADLTASAWAQTYNSTLEVLSAFLTSTIISKCTHVLHPHIYMYLVRCFYFPHCPLTIIWSLTWTRGFFLRKKERG